MQAQGTTFHRIQFWTCRFVPISYFDTENNEWSKDWAKRWALLCFVPSSSEIHQDFISRIEYHKWRNRASTGKIYKALKPLWLSLETMSGNNWHDSESIQVKTKFSAKICGKWNAMFESYAETCIDWARFYFWLWFEDFLSICYSKLSSTVLLTNCL